MIFVSPFITLKLRLFENHSIVEGKHDVAKLDRRNRAIAIVNFMKSRLGSVFADCVCSGVYFG